MTAKDAIRNALQFTQRTLGMLVEDLSDQELRLRPVPGSNHVAWQLGHLIASEHGMIGKFDARMAEVALPAGFKDRHDRKQASSDSPEGLLSRDEYLRLFRTVRRSTLAALETIPEADLDLPNQGPLQDLVPTRGALFLLASNHTLMHVGQFSVLRRQLGKPHAM